MHHRSNRKKTITTLIGVLLVIAVIAGVALIIHNRSVRLMLASAQAYNKTGFDYFNNGDFDNAISNFNQAIKINPDSAEAYSNLGSAYFSKDNLDQAISDFNQAIYINSNYAEAYYARG
jgi:tetratricopeptide (TPR) repeat protein